MPNPTQHLREIAGRGGKVWVVDPRRTETAKATGEHVFIRPDTDVFFFLSFLHVVLELDRRASGPSIARTSSAIAPASSGCTGWSRRGRRSGLPRVTRDRCRHAARRWSASYIEADGAALYCSTGVNMGTNGSLAFWLQEVINAITGNLDRRGGTLVGSGRHRLPRVRQEDRHAAARPTARASAASASVNDALPRRRARGRDPDAGPAPGAGAVRDRRQPAASRCPTRGRLREAFEQLELLVTVDIFKNETGSLAHYVLPATSPFERPDLPFIFPLMLGLQAQAVPAGDRAR